MTKSRSNSVSAPVFGISPGLVRKVQHWLSPPLPLALKNPIPCMSPMSQLALVAGTANAVLGYNLSVLNTAMPVATAEFGLCGLSANFAPDISLDLFYCDAVGPIQGIAVAACFVGAAAGSLACGVTMKAFGRRLALLTVFAGMGIGAILSSTANNLPALLIARLWTGLFVGLTTVIPAVYLTEMAPPSRVATYALIPTVGTNLGVLLGIAVGFPLRLPGQAQGLSADDWHLDRIWWRVMVALPSIPVILGSFALLNLYTFDTPAELEASGRAPHVVELFLWRGFDDTCGHAPPIQSQLGHSASGKRPKSSPDDCVDIPLDQCAVLSPGLFTAMHMPTYRKKLLLGWFISLLQQLTGMAVFVAASNSLFAQAGVATELLTLSSAAMAALQLVCSALSAQQIHRWNRRTLLGGGAALMAMVLLPAVVAGFFGTSELRQAMAIVSTLSFSALFGLTIGPGLFAYLNELFPPEVKDIGLSIAFCINWIACLTVVFLSSLLSQIASFSLFTGTCLFASVFIWLACPETRTTGPMGSGKTTCSQALAAQPGVKVIDADKLGHESYERGSPLFSKLVELFGESILQDGEIHRPTLGKLVFGDPEKLKLLTNLVWPEILRRAKQAIEELELDEETSVVVLEAAVLLEAGWSSLVDHIVLLNLDDDSEVVRRLSQRNPDLPSEEILRRLKSQMPLCERIRTLQGLDKPYTVIDTNKPKEVVISEVSTLLFTLTPPTAEVTASCLA